MSRPVKGLMIKDFKVMISQMKFFFVMMILWGIFMASSLNMSFFVGYIAVLCSFMTLTTFNYDEIENGSAYLFTLPISRKDYIFEKYLFGFLLTTLPLIVASLLSGIVLVVQGMEMTLWEYFTSKVVVLPIAYLLLALEIPLQVKFGQEKSRIITIVLVGCMSASFGIISFLNELAGVDGMEAISSIIGLRTGVFMLIVVAVLVVLMLISYKISCRFMEKKEF